MMNQTTDTDALSREQVVQVLCAIFDPEIPVNIWDLGLIYDLQIAGNDVSIKMTLTAVGCPIGPAIAGEIENKLQSVGAGAGVQDPHARHKVGPGVGLADPRRGELPSRQIYEAISDLCLAELRHRNPPTAGLGIRD